MNWLAANSTPGWSRSQRKKTEHTIWITTRRTSSSRSWRDSISKIFSSSISSRGSSRVHGPCRRRFWLQPRACTHNSGSPPAGPKSEACARAHACPVVGLAHAFRSSGHSHLAAAFSRSCPATEKVHGSSPAIWTSILAVPGPILLLPPFTPPRALFFTLV